MAIPECIPVQQIPSLHTEFVGRYGRGAQFMGFVLGLDRAPCPPDLLRENRWMQSTWLGDRRWYAILHVFDSDGVHLETTHRFAGEMRQGPAVTDRAERQLQELIRDLGEASFCDVRIRLFECEVDGFRCGLIANAKLGDGPESVDLVPNGLRFFEPWAGDYAT